mmetsp:Transcript_7454/g.5671  ORF Transcript_7454/g.5671 Transcript_7454/m.5671 type:complete len:94 (+) Transcript_7454:824-1105(+)
MATTKYNKTSHSANAGGNFGGEDIFEDEEEEISPGPGSYFQPHSSTFNVKSVPERLQFFGSTVARFYDNKKGVNSLGPGTYAVGSAEQKRMRN